MVDEVKKPHFILLGASLDTGNMGVSALLVATVKCIRQVFPSAEISLLEGDRNPGANEVRLGDGQIVRLGRVGVRQNKTFWRQNHLLRLLLTVLLIRLIPVKSWRDWLFRRNPYLKAITTARGVADITGGDSFSDIYGLRRLMIGTLRKALVILTGQKLILLPQTYGPFKGRLAKCFARWVLARAEGIYSRDQESLEAIAELMGNRPMKARPQFAYDMAFVLDAICPETIRTLPGPLPEPGDGTLVGINVSGLLYNGGYTRNNMFGLKVDYPPLIRELVREFLARERAAVLLVPHVFVPPDNVESDPEACRKVYETLQAEYPGRLFCLEGTYDQSEIKSIIGRCDFFIGSRMHACIAAISQSVPAVPLAYSRKFLGVFKSIHIEECIADLRHMAPKAIVDHVFEEYAIFEKRKNELISIIPRVQKNVYDIMKTVQT
jgi:polysaccharide pyruvyl transferase WcaK-like protein